MLVGDNMHELLYFACTVMVIIIILLCICKTKITIEKNKDNILKCTAVITVVLHYSSLWVDYLSGNKVVVENTMLFPIYPCNICMWLLLITAFLKNKDTFIYRSLTEFLAIAGTICGLIGLFANEIFISNPNFYDYGSLKGLLSHTTMIFGTLFILTQGYVRINALNVTISTTLGLLLFIIIGTIINTLFKACGLPEVNAMYLLHFPIDKPGVNSITLGLVGLIILFICLNIYEVIFLNPTERWYYNFNKNKEKRKEEK